MGTVLVASTPIRKILGNTQPLAHLHDHVARLIRLQKLVARHLPPVMREVVRVANFQAGTLFLHVPSPALATRLKLSQESLRTALLNAGENIMEFKIKVRVDRGERPKAPPPRRHISGEGRHALQDLRERLRADDPLARALKKLEDDSA